MTTDQPQLIIGTAGHIDHGKSSLVKALTGTDPDTLPEERERGITIELGFVFMDTPNAARQIVFIDVPGHEKLVKTMVAGAASIDAALFIVAADEGIKPQTIEHRDILHLLDIPVGVIALTKKDLVDAARIEAVSREIRAFAHGTFLEQAPIIPVSAVTGEGLSELRTALHALGDKARARVDSGVFRMPIDRVFTMQGFGTIVAGTVLSGVVKAGDRIGIFPARLDARVRGVQVHREKAEASSIGRRTALNLPDVKKEELHRGQVAAAPGSLVPTERLDVRLKLLSGCGAPLKHRARVRLHLGTAELMCRALLLDCQQLEPGKEGLVQLVLESPSVALPKDQFVIRSFSPVQTIGGGVVIDAAPKAHKRFDDEVQDHLSKSEQGEREALEQVVASAAFAPLAPAEIAARAGGSEAAVQALISAGVAAGTLVAVGTPARYLHREQFGELAALMLRTVKSYLAANPYRMFMPLADLQSQMAKLTDKRVTEALVQDATKAGSLVVRGRKVTLPGHTFPWKRGEAELAARIEQLFRDAGYATPLEQEVCAQLGVPAHTFANIMNALLDSEALVRLDDKVTYHAGTVAKVRDAVTAHLKMQQTLTVAQLRDQMNVTRKYTLALLEYFDKTGVTRRVGDARVLK